MDSRRSTGGILRLLELYYEYPVEFTYDFRSRFQLGFQDIGNDITYLEALHLVSALLRDYSAMLTAAMAKWDYPVSREWILLSQLYDLTAAAASKKKPKPYPGPWPSEGSQRIGSRNQDRSSVIQRLKQMNPKEPNG